MKHWQIRVSFINKAIMTFGVEAGTRLAAEQKAFEFIPASRIHIMDVTQVVPRNIREKPDVND